MRALQSLFAYRLDESDVKETSAYTRTLLKHLGTPEQEARHESSSAERGELSARIARAMGSPGEAGRATEQADDLEADVSPNGRPVLQRSAEDIAKEAERLHLTGRPDQAFVLSKQAADMGDPLGMSLLGHLYRDGLGVAQDANEAVRWLSRAAEVGRVEAIVSFGQLCTVGSGTEKDELEAVRWFRKAADRDWPAGMHSLALMHWKGLGVCQDDWEAINWFRQAADRGQVASMNYLAFAYETGRGITKNEGEAAKWYRRAADRGDAHAQFELGCMHAKGLGVKHDYVRAHAWLSLAVVQGKANALGTRDQIAALMTAEQISEAEELALEWHYMTQSMALPND